MKLKKVLCIILSTVITINSFSLPAFADELPEEASVVEEIAEESEAELVANEETEKIASTVETTTTEEIDATEETKAAEVEEAAELELLTATEPYFEELAPVQTEYKLGLERLKEEFPTAITLVGSDGAKTSLNVIDWNPLEDYDEDRDAYVFEPVLSETDSALVEGITLPTVTVTVEKEDVELVDNSLGDYIVEAPELVESIELNGGAIPSTYNVFEMDVLPVLRNQGSEGCCWAFSALGAVEADLIHDGNADASVDLSELHMGYFAAHAYTDKKNCHEGDTLTYAAGTKYLSNGGNSYIANRLMQNGVGPVEEKYAPYELGMNWQPEEGDAAEINAYRIDKATYILVTNRDAVKQAIMNHNGVGASFYASECDVDISINGTYSHTAKVRYSSTYNSWYGEYENTNHAVMLVGWDDSFPKEHFNSAARPEGDGAWLVRNSWGLNDYGKSGYFWLSYYDKSLLKGESVTAYEVATDTYDNTYGYAWFALSYYDISENYPLNVETSYHVDAGEEIEAVGIELSSTSNNVTVTVAAGEKSSTGTIDTDYAGNYTVKLTKPIKVEEASDVTVKIVVTPAENGKAGVIIGAETTMLYGNIYQTEKQNGTYEIYYMVGAAKHSYNVNGDVRMALYTNTVAGEADPTKATIELDDDSKSVTKHVNETYQIKLTEDSTVSVQDLTWKSTSTGIASVDTNGKITFNGKKGSCVIKGTYIDGQTVSVTATTEPYTISYVADDGALFTSKPTAFYPGDSSNCNLAMAYKEGYELTGWYFNDELTESVTSTTLANKTYLQDITVYPKWKDLWINISYYIPNANLDGYISDTVIANSVYTSNMPMDVADIIWEYSPERYVTTYNNNNVIPKKFSYFSFDAEGKEPVGNVTLDWYKFKQTTTSGGVKTYEHTKREYFLYPQYAENENVTVTLNPNSGIVSQNTVSVKIGAKYGTLPTPERAGYVFAGWYDSSSFSNEITSETTVSTKKDHKLYAKWNQKTYSISYDGNGSTAGNQSSTSAGFFTASTIAASKYTKTGYSFDSWNTSKDGTGTSYNPGDKFEITDLSTENGYILKLYAIWTPNEYTVTLHPNYSGSSTSTKTVTYASTYSGLPTDLTRANYDFLGWYTQSVSGTKVVNGDTCTTAQDHILYAHWEEYTYTIAFDKNNASAKGTMNSLAGVPFSSNKTLTKNTFTLSGKTFVGWNTSSDGSGVSYADEASYKIASNAAKGSTITLYAQWADKSCTVSLDANGGAVEPGTAIVVVGKNYPTLPTPTRTNYEFAGWYTDKTNGTKVTTSTTVSNESDHTLYARWTAKTYSIEFHGNGNTSGTMTNVSDVFFGTATTLAKNTYVKTGYDFDSWNTDVNGVGTKYANRASVKPNDADPSGTVIHLYAQWKDKTISVTLDVGGGSIDDSVINVKYNQPYGVIENPTWENHEFLGWHLGTADGTAVTKDTVVSTDQNHVLVAKWREYTYSIRYDKNSDDATGTMANDSDIVFSAEHALKNCTFTKTGHNFDRWNTLADGTGTKYRVGDLFLLPANTADKAEVVLYAQWSKKTYEITLNENYDGAGESEITVEYSGKYDALTLNTPERPYYKFAGWFTDAAGGTEVKATDTVVDNPNTTLYAHWEEATYTLCFDANADDASGTVDPNTFVAASAEVDLTGKKYDRVGYQFIGWSLDADAESGVITNNIFKLPLSHANETKVTLYAQWIAKSHTVKLHDYYASEQDKEKIFTVTVYYDDKYSCLPQPEKRPNYVFIGWYTAEKGGTKVNNGDVIKTLDTEIFYARFKEIVYKIRFESMYETGEGEGSMADMVNLAACTPQKLTKNKFIKYGYDFLGWKILKNDVESGELIADGAEFTMPADTEDGETIVLAAQWQSQKKNPKKYTVAFNANGGKGTMAKLTGQTETQYSPLPANKFTRTDYTFAGWNTSKDGTGMSYDDKYDGPLEVGADNSTITLYAQWVGTAIEVDLVISPEHSETATVYLNSTFGSVLDNPTKSGSKFLGWFDVAQPTDGSAVIANEYTSNTRVLKEHNKLKLYAWWINNIENAKKEKPAAPEIIAIFANGEMKAVEDGDSLEADDCITLIASEETAGAVVYYTNSGENVLYNDKLVYDENGTNTVTFYAKKDGEESDRVTVTVNVDKNYWGDLTDNEKSNVFQGNYNLFKNSKLNSLWVSYNESLFDEETVSVDYTGSAVKLKGYRVFYGNKLLTEGTDYSVTYKNNTKVAKFSDTKNGKSIAPTMTITGKGNYAGSVSLKFTIIAAATNAVKLTSAKIKIELEKDAYDYTGATIEPTDVKVSLKEGKEYKQLTENTDYLVYYENNIKAGTKATVVIKFKNRYYGEVKKTFKINQLSVADATVTTKNGKYSANEGEIITAVKVGNISLLQNSDFTISKYTYSKKSDSVVATLKGKGNFKGTKSISLGRADFGTIKPTVTVQPPVVTGKAGQYKVLGSVVTLGEKVLKLNTDYELVYPADYDESTVYEAGRTLQVIVRGKGLYTGETSVTYSPKTEYELKDTKVTVTGTNVTYQKKAGICKSKLTIVNELSGKKLTAGKDYDSKLTYTYKYATAISTYDKKSKKYTVGIRQAGDAVASTDIIPAGTEIVVRAEGKGAYKNFNGDNSFTTTIKVAYNMAKATIKVPVKTYTSSSIVLSKDEIVVLYNKVAVDSSNYEIVSYSKNIAKGISTIVVQGNGEFTGTKKVTFKINSRYF